MVLFLSCADNDADLAQNERERDYHVSVKDTVITAVKDSIYRHSNNTLSNGNLFIGYFRNIEASILLEFSNFDSLVLDTAVFDSFRVDSVWLKFNFPRNTGLYADQVNTPFPFSFFVPTIQWQENTASYDTLVNNCTSTTSIYWMPIDTTSIDTVRIYLTDEQRFLVQNWVSNSKNIRSASNNGLWLKADTLQTYSIRSFYSNEAIDSLKPILQMYVSKIRDGIPVANQLYFTTKATKAVSLIKPPNYLPNQFLVGSGDAIRGILWFRFDPLVKRNIVIHKATLRLTRQPSYENFGNTLALNLYYPANDSIVWLTEPTLYPANTQATPIDSITNIDAKFPLARWIQRSKMEGAFIVSDASETILLSRTTFYNTNSIFAPQLHIVFSEINKK
ncbi:MAG: hypothetical protein N2450_04430 [bacterium]|nr:hypothetical protein [bacterium]